MQFPALRVPNRLLEHPIEAFVACLLLLALLFVTAEPSGDGDAVSAAMAANSAR